MHLSTLLVVLPLASAFAASVNKRAEIQCPATDKDGTPFVSSAPADGTFVTCVYSGAGTCEYFIDGSFSSGGSQCPQGVAQDDPSVTTDAPSSAGAAAPTDSAEPSGADSSAPIPPPISPPGGASASAPSNSATAPPSNPSSPPKSSVPSNPSASAPSKSNASSGAPSSTQSNPPSSAMGLKAANTGVVGAALTVLGAVLGMGLVL